MKRDSFQSEFKKRSTGVAQLATGTLLLVLGNPVESTAAPTQAEAVSTMEQRISKLAELFKPIPDAEWSAVAGPKSSETYETVKGDTLYGISKRLFNDPKYWPKIWSLNNDTILNPHRIVPGVKIAFLPGSGSSLPAVAIQTPTPETPPASATPGPEAAPAPSAEKKAEAAPSKKEDAKPSPKDGEWKNLPFQRWEQLTIRSPLTPGADSLTQAIKKGLEYKRPYNPSTLVSSEKIQPLAEIVGSRLPALFVTDQNTTFIEAEKNLDIGKTYSVVAGRPSKITHGRSDRTGYSYPILGKVRIEGIRDGIYLGHLDRTSFPVERGSLLVPEIASSELPLPVAAQKSIVATVIPNILHGHTFLAQYHEVFLDRGSSDGVQVGSIFRIHRHYDPLTERRMSEADFLVEADILVLQTSEEHSLGIITQGHANVLAGDDATLLTDISDVGIHLPKMRMKGGGTELENELDKLEQDGASGLKKDEKRELEQLEEWKKNPPQPKPEPQPEATPPAETPPSGEAPPAPPAEDAALDNPATQGTPAEVPTSPSSTPTPSTPPTTAPPAEVPTAVPTPPPTAAPSLPAPPSEVPEGASDLIPPGG